MILLDGKALSEKILADLKLKIANQALTINLDIILVGHDPASLKYVTLKQNQAEFIGIGGRLHHLPADTPTVSIAALVSRLNQDPSVTGFFIQLPIPQMAHPSTLLATISALKDADGLNPASGVLPAVDTGIIRLINEYRLPLAYQNVTIINDSVLIGQPLKKELEKLGAQVVLCHEFTPDLKSHTLISDILISATGVKNLVTADMVKEGVVAIDVGGGDIDFTAVSTKASYITPTFGGVGPMTVACLLDNTYKLAIRK